MKVIAISRGFYGALREAGDTFEVPEGAKATWFAPVEKAQSAPARKQRKQAEGASDTDKTGDGGDLV